MQSETVSGSRERMLSGYCYPDNFDMAPYCAVYLMREYAAEHYAKACQLLGPMKIEEMSPEQIAQCERYYDLMALKILPPPKERKKIAVLSSIPYGTPELTIFFSYLGCVSNELATLLSLTIIAHVKIRLM